jgi:hypothetical protein
MAPKARRMTRLSAEGSAMLHLRPDDSPRFFVVLSDDGKHLGRIFKSNSAPHDRPWLWTIEWFSRRGGGPHEGFESTREDAMKAFRAAWDGV